ncbi:MAG: DNA-directed RNA polymerase subunit RpoH/Rpb5 C-terminal domain-containing protein [Thermoplasmata archaeon]
MKSKKNDKDMILNSFMMPKHTIIKNPKEENEILQKYNITKDKLPKIYIDDPALKEELKSSENIDEFIGKIVKITRNSQTAYEHIFYRVIVHRTK